MRFTIMSLARVPSDTGSQVTNQFESAARQRVDACGVEERDTAHVMVMWRGRCRRSAQSCWQKFSRAFAVAEIIAAAAGYE